LPQRWSFGEQVRVFWEGGWRYTPTSKDTDITVTACQMMALAAARQSGLKVPKETTDAGVGYIKKCFTPATGAFAPCKGAQNNPGSGLSTG
jgi:prenyltransferase beta subunit